MNELVRGSAHSRARSPGRWPSAARWLGVLATVAGCARAGTGRPPAAPPPPAPSADDADPGACCAEAGYRIAARHRVAALSARRFTPAQLWAALDPIARRGAPAGLVRVREVGRSAEGRPIRAFSFGRGPTTVLLWSQMHGDEPTATMALADVLAWAADPASAADPLHGALHARLGARLTVVAVPMLNPDGAERFRRENAAGADVNRDARRLATPEGRALAALRDSLRPAFGFNLHDQEPRTVGGPNGPTVAVALLAPAADAGGGYGPTRAAARQVASGLAALLARELPGRVARYDEAYEPRAFGEWMQARGTSTVLIESGSLPGDARGQRLRAVNVVAIVSALDAIATGRFRATDPGAYDALPRERRAAR